MNIALVIFRADSTRGGAERYVDHLARTLIARGHQVTLLASKIAPACTLPSVRIRSGGVTRTQRYRRFLLNLERHLHDNKYDIVHSALPVNHCDIYQAHSGLEATSLRESHRIKSSLAGQAASMLGHRVNPKRRAFAAVEARLLNGPTPPITICLSERERLFAASLFPSAASQLVALPDVPDDAHFPATNLAERRTKARKQLGIGADQKVYLFIGQDFRRKGLATAIRALGLLRDPHAILYVLGHGDIAAFSAIAIRADVVGRVFFAGAVTDIVPFMAAADALVLPTRYEPFGMVVIEAMLMGVPPLVSAVAGASEVVDEDRTGYVLADPTDAVAWSAAMKKVADPATRERLSKACFAERPRFSYSAHVDAIEAMHKLAAAKHRLTPGR